MSPARRLQRLATLRRDLLADPIARDDGNVVLVYANISPSLRGNKTVPDSRCFISQDTDGDYPHLTAKRAKADIADVDHASVHASGRKENQKRASSRSLRSLRFK